LFLQNASTTYMAFMIPLRLLELSDVPDNDIREFRASSPWLTMLLVGLVVGFCIWVGLQGGIRFGKGGALPGFLAWWIAFGLGLYWLLVANLCLKSLKPSAWLVRADSQGLYIKWRSYQNMAWQTKGPQVVYVPYSIIAEARRHKRRWSTPEHRHGGNMEVRNTFLELQLRDVDTTQLSQYLAEERAGRPGGKPVRKARWQHFPVALEPNGHGKYAALDDETRHASYPHPNPPQESEKLLAGHPGEGANESLREPHVNDLLRIEWRAKPGIKIVLELLREHGVTITTPMSTQSDLTSHAGEADLKELARQGELMAMIRVMRANSDLSLEEAHTRAKAMIAEMQNTPPQGKA